MKVQGKYNFADVKTDNIEQECIDQLTTLCNQEIFKDSSIKVMPDCLTEEAEVLTENGFKKIINLDTNDKVANYDSATGRVFFNIPKDIIVRQKRENEKIYKYYNKQNNIKIIVSENHRMALKNNLNEIAKNTGDLYIKDFTFNGKGIMVSNDKYSDLDIRLICWIVGDGYIQINHNKTDNYRVSFGLKKQRKIECLIELLEQLHLKYTVSEKKRQTRITINTSDSKKYINYVSLKKTYPKDLLFLNYRQAKLLKDELIKIDGDYESYFKGKGYRINTSKKEEADLLASIFSMNFGLTRIVKRTDIKNSFNKECIMYYVSLIEEHSLIYSKSGIHNRVMKKEEVQYEGKLCCISCDSKFFIAKQDKTIFITGNCHAGKGCVVGFTATIKDKIIPNLVGVDISCSVSSYKLDAKTIDFDKLDYAIRSKIPSGMESRKTINKDIDKNLIEEIKEVSKEINDEKSFDYFLSSLGTLGGGNHFLEVDKDKNNNFWLTIHCGSRNFGKKICDFHQDKAIHTTFNKIDLSKIESKDRQKTLEDNRKNKYDIPNELKYLEGADLDLYVKHMKVAQKYATENHRLIAKEICEAMNWNITDSIFTNHNYIEFLDNKEMIIRKGAISAKKGEMVLIPINMRDGTIVGVGKGNTDWNNSAPHGAGRIMSRSKAKTVVSFDEYRNSMKGIWSSCVVKNTLDESPMAYKPIQEIIDCIGDTIEIIDIIKPVYNFKASE